jgi:transcriptional regulator with XRE-family HTH domain
MSRSKINGIKFRTLLIQRGMGQLALAKAIGVTHYSVNRWCKKGNNVIENDNLAKVAAALEMTAAQVLEECGVDSSSKKTVIDPFGLTPAEADWLAAYRALTPLQQAKARVSIDRMMSDE